MFLRPIVFPQATRTDQEQHNTHHRTVLEQDEKIRRSAVESEQAHEMVAFYLDSVNLLAQQLVLQSKYVEVVRQLHAEKESRHTNEQKQNQVNGCIVVFFTTCAMIYLLSSVQLQSIGLERGRSMGLG